MKNNEVYLNRNRNTRFKKSTKQIKSYLTNTFPLISSFAYCVDGLYPHPRNEKEIIKQLILLDLEKDFIKEFENIKLNFLDSIVLNIFDKYLRLILPYYNFIKEKNIANKLLKNQISEILDKFNRIF